MRMLGTGNTFKITKVWPLDLKTVAPFYIYIYSTVAMLYSGKIDTCFIVFHFFNVNHFSIVRSHYSRSHYIL